MSENQREIVEKVLSGWIDPYLEQDLVTAGAVKSIDIQQNKLSIAIQTGFPMAGYVADFRQQLEDLLLDQTEFQHVEIDVTSKIIAHTVQQGVNVLSGVKNTIAVASGKGGVGKSTTSINLALALQAEGAKVGILDADIYGPSQPRMLGFHGKPDTRDGKSMEPNVSYGLQSMSIGYMIDEETPMIWRGPMATSALEQMIRETNWQELDYLIIDLPPGTGDIQLTLCQKVPLSGALIVTTPQDISLLDARKALKMFEKVKVPVLGIIENMSVHICSECGHQEHIFGEGGGQRMAEEYAVSLLGALPLDKEIRSGVDQGKPTVALQPQSASSLIYRDIARKAAARLSRQAKDYSNKFPKIVIENS